VSVNGGDFGFAVPPNPGTVRIRVGFRECGGASGTAGSATSQRGYYRVDFLRRVGFILRLNP